jgi:hypothetical protein
MARDRLKSAIFLNLEYKRLLNGLASHKYLLFLVLLTFLFSANALSFGQHAAEEVHQAMNQITALSTLPALSAEDAHAVFAHHHGHPDADGQSKDHDSSETHHSHDTEAAAIVLTLATPSSSALYGREPFSYFPEVFLDRFIPPKNHA